jgi:hypothetical protein
VGQRVEQLAPVFNDWAYDRERPVGMSWSYQRDPMEAEASKDPSVAACLGDIFGATSWPRVRRCQATTKSGSRCTQGSLPFSAAPLCLGHHDDRVAGDAANRQQCWAWWCITHGHLELAGHQLCSDALSRRAAVLASTEWPVKYQRALARLDEVSSRGERHPPSAHALAARRLLGWYAPRLCGEMTHYGLPCCSLASRWLERPACPLHYSDDVERAVFCERFSAWMTWREAADPTVQHLHRPVLPNGDQWFFGDVCPGATWSAGFHEGAAPTRRAGDVNGDHRRCERCADAWEPLEASDLPSFVHVGLWERPALAKKLRRRSPQ